VVKADMQVVLTDYLPALLTRQGVDVEGSLGQRRRAWESAEAGVCDSFARNLSQR